ncbi:hypothetical protein A0H81_08524 [Grifola frondosa]|uniref:Uncharacterized protein n=1 Tax=Grifola frondosa TaxID=5627 RepID=A0A1C7M3L7_GRIFR|nr:hypothetical protein A0H81_08524 [Grifola frondosa]
MQWWKLIDPLALDLVTYLPDLESWGRNQRLSLAGTMPPRMQGPTRMHGQNLAVLVSRIYYRLPTPPTVYCRLKHCTPTSSRSPCSPLGSASSSLYRTLPPSAWNITSASSTTARTSAPANFAVAGTITSNLLYLDGLKCVHVVMRAEATRTRATAAVRPCKFAAATMETTHKFEGEVDV